MATADIDEISVSELEDISSSNCAILTGVGASVADRAFFDFYDSPEECLRSVRQAFKWSSHQERQKASVAEIGHCRSVIDDCAFRALMLVDARDSEEKNKFAVSSWILQSARGAIEAIYLLAKMSDANDVEIKKNVARSLTAFIRARRRLGDLNPQMEVRLLFVCGNDPIELTNLVSRLASSKSNNSKVHSMTNQLQVRESSPFIPGMHTRSPFCIQSEVDSHFNDDVERIVAETIGEVDEVLVGTKKETMTKIPRVRTAKEDSVAFTQSLNYLRNAHSYRSTFDTLTKSMFLGFLVAIMAAVFSNQLSVFFVTLIVSTLLMSLAMSKPARRRHPIKGVFEDVDYSSFGNETTIPS